MLTNQSQSLTYPVTVTDDLTEAGWLVVDSLVLLADFLLDSLAQLPVSQHGGLLAHHLVLVVALLHLLHVCRLTAQLQSVRYQVAGWRVKQRLDESSHCLE